MEWKGRIVSPPLLYQSSYLCDKDPVAILWKCNPVNLQQRGLFITLSKKLLSFHIA